jgi:RNA polymerase-binding transcription factor
VEFQADHPPWRAGVDTVSPLPDHRCTMLDEEQTRQIREALQAERARLVRNAQSSLTLSMNRDLDVGRDSIDESTEENMLSTEMRLRDREKWLLGKIDSALERLDAGTIDNCEDCGEPIGYRRLLARPVTTLCIECKVEREREELAMESAGSRGLGGEFEGELHEVAPTED